jgi:peptidoglycan-associated lipoprotein
MSNRKLCLVLAFAFATSLSVSGCSGTKQSTPAPFTPKNPIAQNSRPHAVVVPKDNIGSGIVVISQDIRVACGISENDSHFAFDSATVVAKDRKMLRMLADCFVTGPLKDRLMSLVGHADPRGTAEYNMVLAGKRADNVKEIVVAEAMLATKITTTSRGDMDATGSDEMSWANDRRVDVYLGKNTP